MYSGREVKFTLDYQSVTPACSWQDLTDEEIIIDFSQLADSPEIDVTYDKSTFNVVVSPEGIVTVKFNNLEDKFQTLTDFGGSIVFTVPVRDDIPALVNVTTNLNENIILNRGVKTEETNTSANVKQSYAQKGDVIDYAITTNAEHLMRDSTISVSLAPGMKYVTDSYFVMAAGSVTYPGFFDVVDSGDKVEFISTNPSDITFEIHFQVEITKEESTYNSDIEATYYNGSMEATGEGEEIVENVQTTVDHDFTGSGYLEYSSGQIEVKSVDEEGNKLANSVFSIYDNKDELLDTVTTNEYGWGTSRSLAFGQYQVVQDSAPTGYVAQPGAYVVKLSSDNSYISVEATNTKAEDLDITDPEYSRYGNIQLTSVDVNGDVLAGSEFDVVNSDNNIVDHLVTDENGTATSTELHLGDYQIVETVAPTGYSLNQDAKVVSLKANGDTANVTVVSSPVEPDTGTNVDETNKPVITPVENEGGDLAVTGRKSAIMLGGASALLTIFATLKLFLKFR